MLCLALFGFAPKKLTRNVQFGWDKKNGDKNFAN